jgi:hypothetical protein
LQHEKENIMAQLMHCLTLLFIVFIVAEIRNVLISTDPQQAAPLAIWEEARQPAPGGDTSTLVYRP